jgi:hypothetical protein
MMLSKLLPFALFAMSLGYSSATPVYAASSDQDDLESALVQVINPVVEWNRTLLAIVRTPGAQSATIHSTRNFAILHIAMDDAVINVHRKFRPRFIELLFPARPSSEVAAADQAAHDVLVALYPAQRDGLDLQLQGDLARIPDGVRKDLGISIGRTVAARILNLRANDGSGAPQPNFVSTGQPGDYQLTPPNFSPADYTQWPKVTPFALASADEFRPGPPPVLNSRAYTDSFNEVQSLGSIASTARTLEQTEIGKFWNGNIQDFWNEIAQTATLQRQLDLEQSAHLFALLNISLADTAIAFFEAKYTYRLWRPVTAIQLANTDGNVRTTADSTWLPLSTKTAPDPSYPGAHSAVSAAGAEVLRLFLGDRFSFDVTSESLSGVTRHFDRFSEAAEEAGLSRIYAGQHFRVDHLAGRTLGRKIAEVTVATTWFPGR